MPAKGRYIVIEGHDGTGKSSQVQLLRARLSTVGINSIEVHEPDGAPISSAIRTVIKDGSKDRDGKVNLLLFSAARRATWEQMIKPALENGVWVVAARNWYSSLVYQSYGEGLSQKEIKDITLYSVGEDYIKPDFSTILTLNNEEERTQRIASRGELEVADTFESKDREFQQRVERGYRKLAQELKIAEIDANTSLNNVHDSIWQCLIENRLVSKMK